MQTLPTTEMCGIALTDTGPEANMLLLHWLKLVQQACAMLTSTASTQRGTQVGACSFVAVVNRCMAEANVKQQVVLTQYVGVHHCASQQLC